MGSSGLLRRTWIWASSSLTILFLIVTFTPLVSWYGGKLAGPWNDPDGDILIVLSGGEQADGFPSENTMLRSLYTFRAYRKGHFRDIVVAGFSTGALVRDLLGCEGIPPNAIHVENQSLTTRENAVNAARILADMPGSKILLTSDYHMFRAARAFRKAGVTFLPYPIPDARKRGARPLKRWTVFQDEVLETAKIVYYYLRGWI